MGYIHAPVPYIIGMQTSYLETNIEPPPSDVSLFIMNYLLLFFIHSIYLYLLSKRLL